MLDYAARALLPEGFHDELPPAAERETDVIACLLADFRAHGYRRVKPPLIEFEESLLTGPGAAQAPAMFRLMDPASQRMMAVRADMTVQIARIAATRLNRAPRPLRLSYAGQVLRITGTQLRPERQFPQAGVELIGHPSIPADAEIVRLAVSSLKAAGLARPLTVDLTLPILVPVIADAYGLDAPTTQRIRDALDGKDAARLKDVQGEAGALFRALLAATGPAEPAMARLTELSLPDEATRIVTKLGTLVETLGDLGPGVVLTIDPGEYRAHEYHTGFGFTLFGEAVRGELGRGGRYSLVGPDGSGEEAVGFTIYVDSLLRALPMPQASAFIYLPVGTPDAVGQRLRAERRRTVAGLAPVEDVPVEARRLGCAQYFADGELKLA